MSEFEYLHELEGVVFQSDAAKPLTELWPIFRAHGFARHDDVVSLDLGGSVPPWQHSSIVEVQVLYEGEEVFGFDEGLWDTVRLEYLFASLPFEFVGTFVNTVEQISRDLGISPSYRSAPADSDSLLSALQAARE